MTGLARRLAVKVLLAAALAGAAGSTLAHRFHIGVGEMTENARTGSVEIVHTLMTHDVDALLMDRHKRQVDVSQPDDEALLRAYADEKFYVLDKDGKRLPLKWVGVRAGVDSVVIYQELEKSTLAQIARVHNELLVDFLPRQVNTINVQRGPDIISLVFDDKLTERALK